MRMVRDSRCLTLERLINQDVLKALEIYCAVIVLNARVGWRWNFSKNGWSRWTETLVQLIERSPWSLITCTAHPHVEQLNLIELIFLPPNTTSHTQPMDQGIIHALKSKYRSLAVRKLIAALEKKNSVSTISILSAMTMLEKAWNAVSNKTFTNCFKKAGISEKELEKVLNDEDDPLMA